MKNQVELIIVLIFGFSFLMYLFPFIFVEAAKLESGVTINAPSTTETGGCEAVVDKINCIKDMCSDGADNDDDGDIDADDEDCAAAPAGPTAGKCGVQIVSGFPINYGQLNPDQDSAEQKVTIKNDYGLPTGVTIMIKGGNWVSDAEGNPTISGPEYTHYSLGNGRGWDGSKILSSNESELGWISSGGTLTAFFHFRPMPNVPSGSFHQEVTLDSIC